MGIVVRHESGEGVSAISDAAFLAGRGAYAERLAARKQQAAMQSAQIAAQERQQMRAIQAQAERDAQQQAFHEAAQDRGFNQQEAMEAKRAIFDKENDARTMQLEEGRWKQQTGLEAMREKAQLQQIQEKQRQDFLAKRETAIAQDEGPVGMEYKKIQSDYRKATAEARARGEPEELDRLNQEFQARRMEFLEGAELPEKPSHTDLLAKAIGAEQNKEGQWDLPDNVASIGGGMVEYKNGMIGTLNSKGELVMKDNPRIKMEEKKAQLELKRQDAIDKAVRDTEKYNQDREYKREEHVDAAYQRAEQRWEDRLWDAQNDTIDKVDELGNKTKEQRFKTAQEAEAYVVSQLGPRPTRESVDARVPRVVPQQPRAGTQAPPPQEQPAAPAFKVHPEVQANAAKVSAELGPERLAQVSKLLEHMIASGDRAGARALAEELGLRPPSLNAPLKTPPAAGSLIGDFNAMEALRAARK